MLEELPAHKFLEWMAFDEIEPIGGVRGDWQAASIASTIANMTAVSRGAKVRFRPADFMLEYGVTETPVETKKEEKPREGKTWQEMKWIAQMWVADSKAREKKRKR